MSEQRNHGVEEPLDPAVAMGAACSLSPVDLTRRQVDLRTVLRQAVGLEETAEGVVIRFPATDAAARSVCDAVLVERRCCAQFRYVISFPSENDTIMLSIDATGSLVAPLKALYRTLVTEASPHE